MHIYLHGLGHLTEEGIPQNGEQVQGEEGGCRKENPAEFYSGLASAWVFLPVPKLNDVLFPFLSPQTDCHILLFCREDVGRG